MATGFFGADPEQLRQLGGALSGKGEELRTILARLDTQIENVSWRGPAAERFKAEWRSQHSVRARQAVGALDSAASQAQANARQQEEASSGTSGSGSLGAGNFVAPPAFNRDWGFHTLPYPVFPRDSPGHILGPDNGFIPLAPFPFRPSPVIPDDPGFSWDGRQVEVDLDRMWLGRPEIAIGVPDHQDWSILPFSVHDHMPVLEVPGFDGGIPLDGIGFTSDGEPGGYLTNPGPDEWVLVRPDGSTGPMLGADQGSTFTTLEWKVTHLTLPDVSWASTASISRDS